LSTIYQELFIFFNVVNRCLDYSGARRLRAKTLSRLNAAVYTPASPGTAVVQAFISCCLDYCHALLYGISDSLFNRLQSIQMRRCAFWLELVDATTSHQYFVAYTDFRWSSGSTTSWPISSTSRCEVKLLRTWSTTVSWSWTPNAPSFAPLTPTSSLFREQTLFLATGVSRSRVREFGTVYPTHCSLSGTKRPKYFS